MIAEAVRVVLKKDPFVNASQIRVGVLGPLCDCSGSFRRKGCCGA
jgi:hypothetical protein